MAEIQRYYTLLTQQGAADEALAKVLGVGLPITHIAVGDGNGSPVTPNEGMTSLVNEVYRTSVTSKSIDPDNPNWLIVEAVIPANVGGWSVREVAAIGGLNPDDPQNTPNAPGAKALAVGNFPETYKPRLSEGSAKELGIKLFIEMSSASIVNLSIDPTVVIATKKDVDRAREKAFAHTDEKLDAHNTSESAHADIRALILNLIKTRNVWEKGQAGLTKSVVDPGAFVAVDPAEANNFVVTLNVSATLSFVNDGTNHSQSGMIRLIQPVGGNCTLAFGGNILFPGGVAPTLNTAANGVTLFAYYKIDAGSYLVSRVYP